MAEQGAGVSDRQRWLSVLAKADSSTLETLWSDVGMEPSFVFLRAPEVGLVMTQGRISGTGAPFNLGEMTVTRCSVKLDDARIGHGYVSGRSKTHAQIAALIDALMRGEERERLDQSVIMPLELDIEEARKRSSRKAAATKVEFFTMARSAQVK